MSIDIALQRVNEINSRLDTLGGSAAADTYTWRNFDTVLANAQNRFYQGPERINKQAGYDSGFQSGSVGGSDSNTGIGTLRTRGTRGGAAAVGGPSGRGLTPEIAATIERMAAKFNVPAALVKAVARAESGFNPDAVSHSGAQGMMQLMPATGKGLGVTDPFDATQSIEAGTRYLRNALKAFNGDVRLAVASYNAGVGAVRRAGNEVPAIAETQTYVRRVLAYAREYGLDVSS